jgi:hypothetical protein
MKPILSLIALMLGLAAGPAIAQSDDITPAQNYTLEPEGLIPAASGAFDPGTCYQFYGCMGLSVHVFAKRDCPRSYQSFRGDVMNYGCEPLFSVP